MKIFTESSDFDLITPDAKIVEIVNRGPISLSAELVIENIPKQFLGFQIDQDLVLFNIKSTLAQLGVDGYAQEIFIDPKARRAEISVELVSIGPVASRMLTLLEEGCAVGKLFAADDRRRVRDPHYLGRMFGRVDRWGSPLLSLGGYQGSGDLILDKVEGRCVAYVALKEGVVEYEPAIIGFLPTIAKALKNGVATRNFLSLHQKLRSDSLREVREGELLLVKTAPLHIRTVFAKVVDEYLPPGFYHTTASVLEPHTQASGDIYELFGKSQGEISDIPLEFYTLEPYREFVFFSDRDQLQVAIEDPKTLFKAFDTAPKGDLRAAVFVVKGEQLHGLTQSEWTVRETRFHEVKSTTSLARQSMMVERYIEQQPSYPYLKGIEDGVITSQGILLLRYFPSPLMKQMFLSSQVQGCLKGIYFTHPSRSNRIFFSHEDQAFLNDLNTFGIPVFWVDDVSGKILRYVQQPGHDSGMFVPLDKVQTFLRATLFGIYGSNLLTGDFESELLILMASLLEMQNTIDHPLFGETKPIALVTGGGPGAMEVGNKIAKELGILSCANLVDFRTHSDAVVNEQKQNPYIEAKMTYRLDRLIERQAEFNLDFPIFVMGGIGTDFEFYLEQVRRKVGACDPTPILLFGSREYWRGKISSNFQSNLANGTIKGSEWVSNCFYAVENAIEAREVYHRFFTGQLGIGPDGPIYDDGFCA